MQAHRVIASLLAAALALLVAACAAPPLGDDWDDLDPAARDARAVRVAREVFAGRIDALGGPLPGLEVVSADAQGIAWRTEAGASALRWLDVESVDDQVLTELPSRPESLYLVVTAGSPSARGVHELVTPTLARVGVGGPTLTLAQRPPRSRERLVAALAHLRRSAVAQLARAIAPVSSAQPASEAAPAKPAPAQPAPPASEAARLDALEQELTRLQRWREQGLITEAEHAAARQAVLERLAAGR